MKWFFSLNQKPLHFQKRFFIISGFLFLQKSVKTQISWSLSEQSRENVRIEQKFPFGKAAGHSEKEMEKLN